MLVNSPFNFSSFIWRGGRSSLFTISKKSKRTTMCYSTCFQNKSTSNFIYVSSARRLREKRKICLIRLQKKCLATRKRLQVQIFSHEHTRTLSEKILLFSPQKKTRTCLVLSISISLSTVDDAIRQSVDATSLKIDNFIENLDLISTVL